MKHLTKRTVGYYQQLLTAVFEFMIIGGMKGPHVLKVAIRALKNAQAKDSRSLQSGQIDLAFAGLILDAWHRNRRYLDSSARPKAIPLLGKSPSVEALVRAEHIIDNPLTIVRRLKGLKLIIPSGRNQYKPANRIAVTREPNSLLQQHAVRALSALLKTIRVNLVDAGKTRALIERTAEVPDLPIEHMAEFKQFAGSQGGALLSRINDWLESRRAVRTKRRRGATIAAGIHVFAYLGKTEQKKSRN